MEKVEDKVCFGGRQQVWKHESSALGTSARFAVFLPPAARDETCPVLYFLSGLTCTEQNFITKGGAQRLAAELGLFVVCPDTSPRGDEVADSEDYDLGQGAGFYVNATEEPWKKHYRMADYVVSELPALIREQFPASDRMSVTGHSMGGHGALVLALRNPGLYRSVSAIAPIVAPTEVPWGHKALSAYLGDDPTTWAEWDAVALLEEAGERLPLLVDQGAADPFLDDQLQPNRLVAAAERVDHPIELRMHEGYDHSYYFIATVIDDHLRHAAAALKG